MNKRDGLIVRHNQLLRLMEELQSIANQTGFHEDLARYHKVDAESPAIELEKEAAFEKWNHIKVDAMGQLPRDHHVGVLLNGSANGTRKTVGTWATAYSYESNRSSIRPVTPVYIISESHLVSPEDSDWYNSYQGRMMWVYGVWGGTEDIRRINEFQLGTLENRPTASDFA